MATPWLLIARAGVMGHEEINGLWVYHTSLAVARVWEGQKKTFCVFSFTLPSSASGCTLLRASSLLLDDARICHGWRPMFRRFANVLQVNVDTFWASYKTIGKVGT